MIIHFLLLYIESHWKHPRSMVPLARLLLSISNSTNRPHNLPRPRLSL